MQVSIRHAIGGACLLLSSAVATATPVSLDTELKAAAGVATAMFESDVPRTVAFQFDDVREYADMTLRIVNAATTPAALIGAGPVTINCSVSGSLQARMADVLPRVLRVQWNDCVMPVRGYDKKLNGPVAITLAEDTFQPQSVPAIRMGNASGEFLQQWRSETAEQIDDVTLAIRMAMRGDISLAQPLSNDASSFVANGYMDTRTLVESPVGSTPFALDGKLEVQQLSVVRSVSMAGVVNQDDTQFVSGSAVFTQTQRPPYGTFSDTYKFNGLHVRRDTDYEVFTEQLSMDGRMNVTWSPWAGAGCMDGVYAFKTRVPLFRSLFGQALESGEIAINGSVIASFYSSANTPPGLPAPSNGMLLSVKVRDVGTFNYDVASWYDAVVPTSQCRP